ncbi:MAG: 16S rRNA pseudouridine(516) synthase [Sutterellaceae bacterium]|nr:16S rRNA pseudouridine(516) synthase [Sutterellaceae bacterium]
MRLEQVLFSQGFGTRHECRGLIALGRVTFNGVLETDPDAEVDVLGASFTVDGQTWPYCEKALILLNKPAGYECSQKPLHHPSVMTLLPVPMRVRGMQPVGRLDADTTGLLLLTDDGALQHRLTHPKKHVAKRYRVTCKHPYSQKTVDDLLKGVKLVDEKTELKAQEVVKIDERTLDMTITSGKYHQVKRMVAAAGNRVEALERVAFGDLVLPDDLPVGKWMWLPGVEVILSKNKSK